MSSLVAELRAQIERIEEEMMKARRKLQEASLQLPRLYQAAMLLASEEEAYYIPRTGAGANRTDRILKVLGDAGRGMKPIEIARTLDDDPKAIRTMLVYAKRRGLVQDYEGCYYIPGTFNLPAEITNTTSAEKVSEAA